MGIKSPTRLAAEKLCAEMPDAPSLTLAKKLAKRYKTTIESARSHVRKARGNIGEESRKFATSPRDNQPAGWKPEMPPSLASKWEPFHLGGSIRVAVLSDMHVPYHSMVAINAAVKHTKRMKPDVLLLNGDIADFYSVSRHQKDPSKRDLESEITAVREMLAWLRQEYGKKCRIVYKLGNHEERWQHWLWNAAPEISNSPRMDVREWIEADKYGIEVVGDQRPIMAGKCPIFHGHEFGKFMQASVNPARGLFMRICSTGIQAHVHRTSQHTEPNWRGEATTCWSQGALCAMNPEYARVTKWNWGGINLDIDQHEEFHVDNFRIGPAGEIW